MGDVPLLAQSFLREFAKENNKPVNEFTADALETLMGYTLAGQCARVANRHRARGGVVPRRKNFVRAICPPRCAAARRRRTRNARWREVI